MEQQFKVGSVYRQRNGQIVRLHPAAWSLPASDGVVHAKRLDGLGEGHRYPTTGKEWDETMVAHNRDLIPGELTLVNGEWVGFDFKNKKDPAQQTWQEQAARHAKACEVPAIGCPECAWGKVAGCWRCGSRVAADDEMVARDGPDRPAWQPAPQPTPEPANKPQGPHAAFFALRVDVPAGHLLGQGVKS